MALSIKYNCGCAYELEEEFDGPIATKIVLCILHKSQLTPPQPPKNTEIGEI